MIIVAVTLRPIVPETSLAPAMTWPPTKVHHESPMAMAAIRPALLSNLDSKRSPVVNPFTLSDQRLILGAISKAASTALRAETPISHEPEIPRLKPRPPMAILKPPPRSVAAPDPAVLTIPMFLSAARKDSFSFPFCCAFFMM